MEVKSIFNLFDQNNLGEIDIKQLNNIIKQLDEKQLEKGNQQQNKQGEEDQYQEGRIELKVFPNKKSSLNLNDFTLLYNECMQATDIQDELLLNSFKTFDQNNQGYINSEQIKVIFELFKDKTSQDEIQSNIQNQIKDVLKFVGCSDDKMTYQQFKEFFKKNI